MVWQEGLQKQISWPLRQRLINEDSSNSAITQDPCEVLQNLVSPMASVSTLALPTQTTIADKISRIATASNRFTTPQQLP